MNFDWVAEFTRKYKNNKWAAFSYMNRPLGTHKDLNGISRNVRIIQEFLTSLQHSGALNNTIVFLGGDHGNGRAENYFDTEIGSYEARLPLGYIITPKWFQTKYQTAYNNLKFNGRERLTSHFDTYKTFKAIMNQEYKHPPEVARVDEAHPGVSLFQPLPEWRGCREAGIPSHYCLCDSFQPVPQTDPRVTEVSRTIVETINGKLEPAGELCVKYSQFHVNVSKISSSGKGFSIVLKLIPYPANFRAYVNIEGDSQTVQDIERLDNYRDLSVCLDKLEEEQMFRTDNHLASFCVCSDLKLNYRREVDPENTYNKGNRNAQGPGV